MRVVSFVNMAHFAVLVAFVGLNIGAANTLALNSLGSFENANLTPITDLNLTNVMDVLGMTKPPFFVHAMDMIARYDFTPSCTRMAVMDLLDTCSSLEADDPRKINILLVHVKDIFAARLALCELEAGNTQIPSACSSLANLKICSKTRKQMFGRKMSPSCIESFIDHDDGIFDCLKALASQPQSWTSFSNARQNAVVMCDASRSEREQNDAVNMYRSMVETYSGFNDQLVEQLKLYDEVLANQKVFTSNVQNMQAHAVDELATDIRTKHAAFEEMLGAIETNLATVFKDVIGHGQNTEELMRQLSSRLDQSSEEAATVKEAIRSILNEVAHHAHDVAAIRQKDSTQAQSRALELSLSLEKVNKKVNIVADLLKRFETEATDIADFMAHMAERQASWIDEMNNAEHQITKLQAAISKADEDFQKFATANTQVMAEVVTRMQATIDAADKMTKKFEAQALWFAVFQNTLTGFPLCVVAALIASVFNIKISTFAFLFSLALFASNWISTSYAPEPLGVQPVIRSLNPDVVDPTSNVVARSLSKEALAGTIAGPVLALVLAVAVFATWKYIKMTRLMDPAPLLPHEVLTPPAAPLPPPLDGPLRRVVEENEEV